MSHFISVRVQVTNQAVLKTALETLGFDVQCVEPTARALGYTNTYNKRNAAHVVARHAELRDRKTAIGFRWSEAEEAYQLQCDPWEIRNSQFGQKYGQVEGDTDGNPTVTKTYSQMWNEDTLETLRHQLEIAYNRELVRSEYTVLSEIWVGTELQITATAKPQVSLGASVAVV